uniref:Uncharacterized protein n=1 Tax=Arundo donax TaxID=35708 RepID=A0A0A8Z6T1_ARUDO
MRNMFISEKDLSLKFFKIKRASKTLNHVTMCNRVRF